MGTKKTIGYYRYNPNRPTWAINLGGILQGLSFFFGFCAVTALVFAFRAPIVWLGVAGFTALTIICQLSGRRLAIGKKQKSVPNSQKVDPALVELIGKLRERGVSDKDIADAFRAVKSGEMSAKSVAEKLQAKARVKK